MTTQCEKYKNEKYKKELEKIGEKYGEVCDRLENLNAEAFELEKHIMYLKIKMEEEKKNEKVTQSC